jgi:hypothetical protein
MTRFTRTRRNATRSPRRARNTRRDIIRLRIATASHPQKTVSLTMGRKANMIIKQRKIKRLKNKNKTKFNNHRSLNINNPTNKIRQDLISSNSV